ncbi:MAG: Gfo/Idh/MocA family oxidoreductase [Caldilineaceae bacterium]|nr:Gfo/Idh/MocA family oxidoreductase [Caldilineaceae bacterium]
MEDLIIPAEPVKTALIGAGTRAQSLYVPLLSSLKPWIEITAICDPVRQRAEQMAQRFGVPAFSDVHALVHARPMEAALVVTPPASHYPIGAYLAAHGIHNLLETPWCNLLAQARDLAATARANQVIAHVAENHFRFPLDRIVCALNATGWIGPIRRVVSYCGSVGYHNNGRWLKFAGSHPTSVQSISHTMPTAPYYYTPERLNQSETYVAKFYHFPGDLLIVDQAANIKSLLGRQPRPGYTEWHGGRGAIVYRGLREEPREEGEVRYCSDAALAHGHGLHDQVFPIVNEFQDRVWLQTYVDLPAGRVEYVNPFRPHEPGRPDEPWMQVTMEYGVDASIMDTLVDFALAVRGLRASEFDEQDAMMSLMMELGARESARDGGKAVSLPLVGELEVDTLIRNQLKQQVGADPLDVDAMLAIAYPKV